MSPDVAGDPMQGRRWTIRSLPRIQAQLAEAGHEVSIETIRRVLHKHRIRPKSHIKRLVPRPHPDRDLQFQYIQAQRAAFEKLGLPIVSIDSKKKELIGLFAPHGQSWSREAPAAYLHDFPSDALGRAVPYGIYDVGQPSGHVYVGQSADTPAFAVDNVVAWWREVGQIRYPDAREILLLADGGGSNGYRLRLWKYQLQHAFANQFGVAVTVAHYPPGASKWNPIEHRLFSQISHTLAGTMLTSFAVLVEAIRSTTTTTGLTVQATLVEKDYPKGVTVTDDQMKALLLHKHTTCPDWNYTIRPDSNREVIS